MTPSSRTFSRLAVALATAAAAFQPVAASARPDAGDTAVATTAGTAFVGFRPGHLPRVAPGATWAGHTVLKAESRGDWLLLAAHDLGALRDAVAGVPGVAYVEDNPVARALVTPNDTRYGEQYGPPMMGFPAAWDQAGYGSSSVVVAVIDSGIYRAHEDFTPASRIRAGRDYIQNDNDPQDACGHGTHVSGTIGATTANAKGVAGMSQATILPMRTLTADIIGQCTGSYDDISQSIMDATDQGARVISMSIGGGASSVLENAVNYAHNRGVLLVAAAGNGGSNNGVDYPGAYPNVIAVAAVTSTKARASYSDGGPQVDIAAPGSNVLSTYSNGGYSSLSGTSMATPHVSGALALALSCAPSTTAAQARDALYATAEDLGTTGFDNIYGNGLARADRLVSRLCGGGTPANRAPVASFTATTSGLSVSVNGSGSTDPDGDPLSYSWAFGDGATATGATASRTYAAAGTYTVTLTVSDGRGGTHSASQAVTVATAGDPDPSTPTITSGQLVTVSSAAGQNYYYKINVPSGASQLQVVLDGPACGLLSCSVDADLYTRPGARPTDTTYACRPYASGSDETCTHSAPAAGWWYVRIHGYSGSGSLTLRATVS